jgi:hypothetical protein
MPTGQGPAPRDWWVAARSFIDGPAIESESSNKFLVHSLNGCAALAFP